MEACSSSKEDEQNFAPSNLVIVPLSATPFDFIHSAPFLRKPLSSIPRFPGASDVVVQVQKSVASNVDRFMKMVDTLRSQHAVLDKVMSFSSYLQSFCQGQVRSRKCQNVYKLSNHNFAAILPGDTVAGVVVANGILNFLNIYNTLLIVRLVLTWFPSAPPAVVSPLSTLCDPYLNIFRGIIPPLGGTLDLSPILAFLVLNAFTSAAAALPAELPPAEASNGISSHTKVSHFTTSQRKWMRRLAGNKPKSPGAEI